MTADTHHGIRGALIDVNGRGKMKRRAFIAGLCGTVGLVPFGLGAQPQPESVRRIGALLYSDPPDLEHAQFVAFTQQLSQLGWVDGQTIRLQVRSSGGDPQRLRGYAAELLADSPDVVVAASAAARVMLQETRTTSIVFVNVSDPVGLGLVADLAHPGGNSTGFYNYDFDMAGKWLETLKDIAPRLSRVALLGIADTPGHGGWLSALRRVAAPFAVEIEAPTLRQAADVEGAITEFARIEGGGLMVLPDGRLSAQRDLIVGLAERYRLPAIYPRRDYTMAGGLASYGIDSADLYRRAAAYVDRILRGTKPGDLPVQGPTKFELVINLKTAAQLGLAVPQSLRLLANELIR